MDELAAATGIHRTTLYKIGSKVGYNTTTENLSRLCTYFKCELADVAEYVPDDKVEPNPVVPAKAVKSVAKRKSPKKGSSPPVGA